MIDLNICEHGGTVNSLVPIAQQCQKCDFCQTCEQVRRFDGEVCSVCKSVWGEWE